MKYNNTKTVVDGIKFDSLLEASYYLTLVKRVASGKVDHFIIHPKFVISKGYIKNGKKIPPSYYVLDFQVFNPDGTVEFIDTKGFATPVSKLKRKLLESQNPDIRVKWLEINHEYGDEDGWIEKEKLQEIIKKNKKDSEKWLEINGKLGKINGTI